MARRADLHEDYSRLEEVKAGSDRRFGLTMALACAVFGVLNAVLGHTLTPVAGTLFAAGAVFLFLALVRPRLLAPLNRLWLKLGLLLNRIISPLVLGLLFYVAVTPTGLVLRLMGKDPLRLKSDPGAKSYWIERRPPGPPPETMRNQF